MASDARVQTDRLGGAAVSPPSHGRLKLSRQGPGASIGRLAALGIGASLLAGQPAAAAPPVFSASAPTAAPDTDDPCEGLFATMDRPTAADSSCVVKPGRFLTELGYQAGPVKGSDTAHLAFYPQASLRFGLPDGWELRVFPPNYNMTDVRAAAGGGRVDGFGDTAVGAKYQLGTFGGFTVAADAKVTAATGNQAFSGGGMQGNVQLMVSYSLTPKLGVLAQFGASSLTNRAEAGQVVRFASGSANFVIGYQVDDRWQVFSEVIANSVTAPNTRGNLSYLGGVQFLLTKSIELDVAAGALLTGPQGVQARFFGVGTGLIF